MQDFGKVMMFVGAAILLVGLLLWSGFGRDWLGRLPGDVSYSRGDFIFHVPFMTSLLLSLLLTLVIWLFRR